MKGEALRTSHQGDKQQDVRYKSDLARDPTDRLNKYNTKTTYGTYPESQQHTLLNNVVNLQRTMQYTVQ